MIGLLLLVSLSFPSDSCFQSFDPAWCESGHADQLAAAKPVFADLAVDNVGGYRTGDPVATGHGDTVPVPKVTLDAVNRTAATPDEARLMVDLAACESRFHPGAQNASGATGGFQFLRSTWSRVAAATGLVDIWSWHDQAHNALWLGRNGGWQHWSCLGLVR